MKPLTQRALLATAVWAAVSAQTASAQLEEVLVTAERREANLQDTPISITTFSDQEIIDRGINSADDLITQVAGVYGYTPPGSAGSPGFNIRGIGDGASTNLSLDTAVAKYIDGVYLGKGPYTPATCVMRSSALLIPRSIISWSLRVVIEIGVSCRLASRRSAVTSTSSS